MADPLNLNPTITTAGRNLIPVGSLPGFQIVLTHISIGTGQYDSTQSAGAASLVAEVARYAITSGTKPTPSSLQIGTTITDTDSFGNSPNGKSIGEIGFWAGSTLFAVWSRVGDALFVKSPQFDVPFAYTLDQSILPQASVSVSVTTDPAGMAALILQHAAQADPHKVYVKELHGIGYYDPLLLYDIGAHVRATSDGKTYRSLVTNNVGFQPQTSPTKWERWGHSVAEMGAEFVPVRTGRTTPDGSGITRVTNPDAAYLLVNGGAVAGALKIRLPIFSSTALIQMRLDVQDEVNQESFSLLITGLSNVDNSWGSTSASVIGQAADRDLTVRFGSDGAKQCIWIGELATLWHWSRIMVSDVMVSSEADGGAAGVQRWSTGWQLSLVTAFGAVGVTLTGNLVFGQSSVAKVAGLQAALNAKVSLAGNSEIVGNVGVTGVLALRNNTSLALQSTGGTYTAYMRADVSGQVGLLNQAQNVFNLLLSDGGVLNLPRARPTWAGLNPWDNGNLPAPAQTTGFAMTGSITLQNSTGLIMQSGGYSATLRADASGIVGFINQANNLFIFTIRNDGFISSANGANFGLRPTWQGLVPWDNGNLNPGSFAPVRHGGFGGSGYVVSDTPNTITVNWSSGGYNIYTDGQYQGNIVTVSGGINNISNYATPVSSMQYNGVGSYAYVNNGNNPGVGQLFGNLLGGGGTWMCMSGGFGTAGKDYLYVRIS